MRVGVLPIRFWLAQRLANWLLCGLAVVRGHHFIGRVLSPQAVVLDLGAHRGEFAKEVKSRWGARCISVEADSLLFEALDGPDQTVHAAIAGQDGETSFFSASNPEAGSIFTRNGSRDCSATTIRAVALETLMNEVGVTETDLVKLDVEGAEIAVLLQASESTLRRVRQITVEFHDFTLPEITAADVDRVKRRLHDIGFWSISFSKLSTDVLFINKRSHIIGPLAYFWLAYVVRNGLGFGRTVRRRLGQ
jgi:FkbM family methyltransferase